jgi:hypothetical protein
MFFLLYDFAIKAKKTEEQKRKLRKKAGDDEGH